MKLVIFVIIIILVYFIAINIQVVHITTLPPDQQKELQERNKIRRLITSSNIKCTDIQKSDNIEKFASVDSTNKNMCFSKILKLVEYHLVDSVYKFNIIELPVFITTNQCGKYAVWIKSDIQSWQPKLHLQDSIDVVDFASIVTKETDRDFLIISHIKLIYQGKTHCLETVYYGKIFKTDDFLNGGRDSYQLQLVDFREIPLKKFGCRKITWSPFMPVSQQMIYVEKVRRNHKLEAQENE